MAYHEVLPTPDIPAHKGVFTTYGSSEIEGSPEQIWTVLCDLPNYSAWNRYTVSVTPKQPGGGPTDHALIPGQAYTLQYRPNPTGKTQPIPIKVRAVDHNSLTICWDGRLIPSFLLRPQKVQKLTPVSTPDGRLRTKFEIFETQAGPLAYLVKWLMYSDLQAMTQGIADNLKEHVEGRTSGATVD